MKLTNSGRRLPLTSVLPAARNSRRKPTWERGYYSPMLEWLESRLTPTTTGYVDLASQLTFFGDYNSSGTTYSFQGANPVEIGFLAEDRSTFKKLLDVTGGANILSFDTFAGNNTKFQISGGTVKAALFNGEGTNPTLFDGTESIDVKQFVAGGASLSSSYTISLSSYSFTLNSIGIGSDPFDTDNPKQSLLLQGSLSAGLPGKDSTSLVAAITGNNHLYASPGADSFFDLSGLSLSLTTSFELAGVTFQPQGLTINFAVHQSGTFSFFGNLNMTTKSPTGDDSFAINVAATIGTSKGQGISFVNWDIDKFNLGLNGGFSFCGVSVQAVSLSIGYNSSDSTFTLQGGLALTLGDFTISALLQAQDGTAGITVTDGVVEFNGVTLKEVTSGGSGDTTGSFGLQTVSLTFGATYDKESPPHMTGFTLGGSALVNLPRHMTVGGIFEFTFSNGSFRLDELGLSFTGNFQLGDDVFLTSLSGELVHGLGNQGWTVSGSVGLAFGQELPIAGKQIRIVQAAGSVLIDKDHLVLTGHLGFGTYGTNKDGSFQTLFGDLNGSIDADWADGTYTAEVDGEFLDNVFTVQGNFSYSAGHILLTASADLRIPNKIPIIGGDTLVGANFEFQFDANGGGSNAAGLFAAWLKLPIIGDVGIEDQFGAVSDPGVQFIGKAGVEALNKQGNTGPKINKYSEQFVVPDGSASNGPPAGATEIDITVQWVVNHGDNNLEFEVTDPSGKTFDVQTSNPSNAPPGQRIVQTQLEEGDGLTAGTYTLTMLTTDTLNIDNIIWTDTLGYATPIVNIPIVSIQGAILTVQDNIPQFERAFVPKAIATLYVVPVQGQPLYSTQVFAASTTIIDLGDNGFQASFPAVDLNSLALPPGQYTVVVNINDKFHPPIQTTWVNDSQQVQTFTAQPELTGKLTETGDGRDQPLKGFTVYLDLNGNGQFDLIDPIAYTNSEGVYVFYDDSASGLSFQQGKSYTVGVVVPPTGYEMANDGPNKSTFQYNGGTSTVNFQMWQSLTIFGVVLNDSETLNSGVAGIAGVTVYLDINQNGILDIGDPTAGSLSDGSYAFVGYEPIPGQSKVTVGYSLPAGYLAQGPTAYVVKLSDDPLALYASNDFSVQPQAMISGTVTSNQIFDGQLGSTPVPEPNITVQATDTSTGLTTLATTDASGKYIFSGLTAGNYLIQQSVPSGYTQVAPSNTNANLSKAFLPFDGMVTSTVMADFNNDGALDLATVITSTGQPSFIDYFYGDGHGHFAFSGLHVSEGLPRTIIDMQTGDFNGDGFADLLCLGSDGSAVAVYGGQKGFASSGTKVYTATPGATVYGMAVDNMSGSWDGSNKDGFAVYGQEFDNNFHYYFVDAWSPASPDSTPLRTVAGPDSVGSNTGAFSSGQLAPLSAHALAIGDLNGDGKLDLFMNFSFGAGIVADYVAYGHGDASFGQLENTTSHINLGAFYFPDLEIPVPGNCGPMALADLNGDHILDAVTADFNFSTSQPATMKLFVLEQSSVATWIDQKDRFASNSSPFLPVDPLSSGNSYFVPAIYLVDIDGDGKPDLTLAEAPYGAGEGQVLTYFNRGNDSSGIAQFENGIGATYLLLTPLAEGAEPNSMAVGDYDNNGQVDLVLGEATYGKNNPKPIPGGVWLVTNNSQIVSDPLINAQPNTQSTVNFFDLVSGLVQVYGTVYGDSNGNGQLDPGDPGQPGVTVYLDVNDTGSYAPGDPFTTTNASGTYAFAGLAPGLVARVRLLSGLAPDQVSDPLQSPLVSSGETTGPTNFAVKQRLLLPIVDATIASGQTLTLSPSLTSTTQKSVSFQPGRLVFTLGSGAPAGLVIDPGSGVLTWKPAADQPPAVYPVTVMVHNTQNPLQSDSQSFQITVLTPNQNFVTNVYAALLGRNVDAAGLLYWSTGLNLGVGPKQIVLGIENDPSNEYRRVEVNQLYQTYLHRSALVDTTGLGHWVAVLQTGVTLEQVSAAIVNSPEFLEKSTDGTFSSWLDVFYSDTLNRVVDASGRAGWDNAFAAGLSRAQIAEDIFTLSAAPGQQGNEYQIDLVDKYYEQFLGRTSQGDAGADYWLGQLQQGVTDEAVLAGILSSSEFFNKPAGSQGNP